MLNVLKIFSLATIAVRVCSYLNRLPLLPTPIAALILPQKILSKQFGYITNCSLRYWRTFRSVYLTRYSSFSWLFIVKPCSDKIIAKRKITHRFYDNNQPSVRVVSYPQRKNVQALETQICEGLNFILEIFIAVEDLSFPTCTSVTNDTPFLYEVSTFIGSFAISLIAKYRPC